MTVMTAAEAKQNGDATQAQRAELRELIARKCVTDEWTQRFYQDVIDAGGLAAYRAKSTIEYLRGLPDRAEQPVYATEAQAEEIRKHLRVRVAPTAWARTLMAKLDAGQLPYVNADLMIRDLKRLPLKTFVAPDAPLASAGAFEDGYYAVQDTAGEVRKYRVVTKGGLREVWQITGTMARQRHRLRHRQARDVINAIGANPAEAARLWAETTKRCAACNTAIEENEKNPGFKAGFGPDCWAKREARRRNRDVKAELADQHPEEPRA